MKKLLAAFVFSALLLPAGSAAIFAAEGAQPAPAAAPAPSEPVTLPKDIVWETDNDEPLIGSEKAIRGGTYNVVGDTEHAIADYNTVLQLEPKNARFLYDRGLAKLKKGDEVGGNADLAAAKKMQPGISAVTAGC